MLAADAAIGEYRRWTPGGGGRRDPAPKPKVPGVWDIASARDGEARLVAPLSRDNHQLAPCK